MKSRMERYRSEDQTPQRTDKNVFLYDEIYAQKKEPADNVTVFDNVNEIDIDKIKSMINNREEYKNVRKYNNLIGKDEKEDKEDLGLNYDEPEGKNYDINEILEIKRGNRGNSIEHERIRKISNTQYDILKGLNVNKDSDDLDDEMDTDFFTQEKQLKTLISTITKEKELQKTKLDFFDNLKGQGDTLLTPQIKTTESDTVKPKENSTNESTFYTSAFSFTKQDFEELADLKTNVKKNNGIMKILIVVVILLVLAIAFVIAYNYIDFGTLLN